MIDRPRSVAEAGDDERAPRRLAAVAIEPPPVAQRVARAATREVGRRSRWSLPERLESASPVGYRRRVSLSRGEAEGALRLLELVEPREFAAPTPVPEGELFDECALGVLSARQSTNFRGQRDIIVGPEDSARVAAILRRMGDLDADVRDGATHTHIILARPYRTAFTLLLTFVGHRPITSLATVPLRALRKRRPDVADIPTVQYLTELHLGILAESMERAAVIASKGRRRAQIFMRPFAGEAAVRNASFIRELQRLCGIGPADGARGWRIALVAQVGVATAPDSVDLPDLTWRRLGAAFLAFRSERVQPGVNVDPKAPAQYHARQDMDVSEALTEQIGRAAYNAFSRWSGLPREAGKALLLLDRVDVLTDRGKDRLRAIRRELDQVTDRVVAGLPKWIDLPTGRLLSRNAERGRKAFALAGQRIYVAGLSPAEVAAAGLDWSHALRCVGAMAARATTYAEIMGSTEIPEGCDLLAGCCMMAGPVNQNDVGKTYFGMKDLLAESYPGRDPVSLLVWTLKAKTVADPIGNEEQLLSGERRGALVDLRPGPHEIVELRREGQNLPMRSREGRKNRERAFSDVGNFERGEDGGGIEGNEGEPWPEPWRSAPVWR